MTRLLPDFMRAVLSVGPGYEPQPLGPQFDDDGVRGYYTDLRSKTKASTAARPEILSPAALAQLGLGWLERAIGGEGNALAEAASVASLLRSRAEDLGAGALVWPYFVPVPKYGLTGPWYSAMAQGQVASFFVRMHLYSADQQAAETAMAAFRGLGALQSQLVAPSPGGPSLEEVPLAGKPSRILNGWIYALWGVRDVGIVCRDEIAVALFDRSTRALAALLPEYDLGWWSRYSLACFPGADIAKPFYHRVHVVQLEAMYRLTGGVAFADYAERWRRVDTGVNTARAVAHKAVERVRR